MVWLTGVARAPRATPARRRCAGIALAERELVLEVRNTYAHRLGRMAHLVLGEEAQLWALDTRGSSFLEVCDLFALRYHLKRTEITEVYSQSLREPPANDFGERSDGVADVPEGEGGVADDVLLDGGRRQALYVLRLGVVDTLAFVFAHSGNRLSDLIM